MSVPGLSLGAVAASEEIPPADLVLSRTLLDRDGVRRHDPRLLTTLLADPATRVLAVRGDRLPVREDPAGVRLALRPPVPDDAGLPGCYLGVSQEVAIVATFAPAERRPDPAAAPDATAPAPAAAPDASAPAPVGVAPAAASDADSDADTPAYRSLRSVGAVLDAADTGIAVSAVAMANWQATQSFCTRCGHRTAFVEAGWVARCDQGHDHYPRTDAAVIMSIVDEDDRLLLARGSRHGGPMKSVLAGFVEPGESLESAVIRESLEEVGLSVDRMRYVGNQPWPMPASLMIGFAATAHRTRLRLDPDEIAEAQWFDRAQLRAALDEGRLRIPPRLSIARHLIETWYGARLPDGAEPPR